MESCWSAGDRERVLAETVEGLWRLVAAHARMTAPPAPLLADLTGTSETAIATLGHLHLLLSPEVLAFVDAALPALLRRARPVAPTRPVTSRVAVRGTVMWHATVAARSRAGGDRALFVAAATHQHHGTAETRLLVRTLRALAASHHALRRTLGTIDGAGGEWVPVLERVEAAVETALEHPALRAVDPTAVPASVDVAACRRAPREAARALARVYALWHELVADPAPAALAEALRQWVLVPLDDDALYEVWALVGAARAFEQSGWTLATAGLVGSDAVPLTFRSADERITARLRFGHTPAHWRRSSRYRAVFEHYGLSGATRRPDLIVDMQGGGRRRHLLVEVKRTRDPGYIADSVYKVFGYLADFDAAFGEQEGARALLLLWDGVEAAPDAPHGGALVLAAYHTYAATLQWAIRSCLHSFT